MMRRMAPPVLVAALLTCLALAGCGGDDPGSSSSADAVGGDATAPPDAETGDASAGDGASDDIRSDVPQPDAAPDAAVDAAPDAAPDVALDAGDGGGGGDACTCAGEGPCCDGCHPVDEGGACAHDEPCVTPGVCTAGVCEGGGAPVVCDPPGPCRVGDGVCDPASGGCVYELRPDGTPCEATAGIDGSGLCGQGECHGFGACDHRTYDQAPGWPCNADAECAEGRCVAWGDDWARFCARPCGEDLAPCPAGTFCVADREGAGRICRPLSRDALPPDDGSQPLFAVCNDDDDCEGGLCLALDGARFCTGDCESATNPGTASDEACGSCGTCRDNGDELGFAFAFYCVPRGEGRLGDPCAWDGDCRRRFCRGGLCSEQCIEVGGVSSCPDHMVCVGGLLSSDPAIHVCAPAGEVGGALGDACVGDHGCAEGQVCAEVLGRDVCTVDCAGEDGADLPCAEGVCVEHTRNRKACLPEAWVGATAYGDPCDADFQCAGDSVCFRGACLAACEGDAGCDGATCLSDAWYQARYCAPGCAAPADCPERMTCRDGACVLHAGGAAPLGTYCRVDEDCASGLCVGGLCSEACSADVPCESSVAFPVPEWGLCKPCDPNNFGADCDEDWGLSECIQGSDGTYFCAPECWIRGPAVCPVGTRCYGTGGASAVCAPISGSCTLRGAACTSRGVCVPPGVPTAPCVEDADCGADGACVAGRCAGLTCEDDAGCGCAALVCADGACVVDPAAGDAESEPNDALATAQSLAAAPQTVLGTLVALEGAPDVDLFTIPLAAGQTLDVWTSPFCGQYADTRLRFFTDDGVPLDDWVFDSVAPDYPFSILDGYAATGDETVVVEVTQGGAVRGNARANYVLDVNVFEPAANDTCAAATTLPVDGSVHTFDLTTANRDMTAASCTGAAAGGKDMAFAVTVPAGHVLTVHGDTPFDSQLYLVADCAAVPETCVAGADALWEPGPETLVYANESDAPEAFVLVVDSFLPEADMTFALTARAEPIEAVPNDTAATAMAIPDGTSTASLVTAGAADDYDGGDEGCVGVALPGRDVVYVVDLAPGAFLTVTTDAWAGVDPVLLLTSDPGDPQGCLAVAQGLVHYRNTGAAAETVWLVVDALQPAGYGQFTLSFFVGGPDTCFGPCVAGATPWACVAGTTTDLCWCDAETGTLTPFDCDAYCVGDSALSGVCHSFTAPGHERDSCRCDYDCALPNDHCEREIYTDCTCGAADPCGWSGNGGCDEFCAIEYPDDHFDDAADCAPAE